MEDFGSVIRDRRSIRKYLPEKVPDAVLREVLDEACWAPSWGNAQSTSVYVLSGNALERFKASLLERSQSETPPSPDLDIPMPWPEPFQGRMMGSMEARTAFMAEEEKKRGIVPPDPPVSRVVAAAGLFGAPHLLVVATSKDASKPYACFDAGLFTQTIALAAQARGLGTCIMAAVILFPELLRALIPDSEKEIFIIGVAIGYSDRDAITNQSPRERVPLAERVQFFQT